MSSIGELRTLTKSMRQRGEKTREKMPDNKAGFLFLLPWLIGLVCITIGPMVASLYLSLTDYNLLQPPQFVGLKNYLDMFDDPRLWNSLRVTVIYVVVGVPLQLLLALGIALVLNRGMRGLAFYRSIMYLPSLLGGSVAVAVLWRQVFGSAGLVNSLLAVFGVQGPGWISSPDTALSTIILLHIWTFGSPMIIFLAGLRQIPGQYYEAAEVDGAGPARRFFEITLPLLSPVIFFNLVLQIIFAFQSFTQAFIVSGGTGGPADSTLFFTLYLYQQGFGNFNMGYASAMAWFLLLIVAAFTAVNFWLSRYWVFYEEG
ncbi:carbohydrate ABC transporter permease [Gryllotalpicola ginsengisoli]|uniref:carbohydrate ABC transporter permease n=1 Tax=Gryllotalpicola ginsengisoli TaxID=444608 RepID=UPI0003B6A2E4|nr:sugar ABC transporter permease [Gryllotalpicola ginsengisoli]